MTNYELFTLRDAAGRVISASVSKSRDVQNWLEIEEYATKCAYRILQDHKYDDNYPISEDWLLSVGFEYTPSDMGPKYDDHMKIGKCQLWEFNDTGEWLFNEYDRLVCRSRKDVRSLCELLRIKLKE